VRFFEDLIPGFEHAGRFPQVGGHCQPHLVDHIQHAFAVYNEIPTHREPASLDHQLLEAVDEIEYFHRMAAGGASS
jgi:hypothetical protein